MPETQLLERFISENDQAAFRALIDRHGPMVLAVCRSVLDESHDVEDAFQTTFLVLVQNAPTIRRGASLGPWLHRVALRVSQRARATAAQRRAARNGAHDPRRSQTTTFPRSSPARSSTRS